MSKFIFSGETFIINKRATQFIKRSNGYVIPVELFIRFYFSLEHSYTFLGIIKPFLEMAPFRNGKSYSTSDLIFLVVENEKEGHIYDYSESSIEMLQSYGLSAHT